MSPKLDVSMSAEEIQGFLAEPLVGTLTTLGQDGWPHSTGMWYLPGDDIAMWTYAKSQKARNITRDPRCSFLVGSGLGYGELRGVMIQAHARLVTEPTDVAAIGTGLFARYQGTDEDGSLPEPLRQEIARQATKRVGITLALERVASWDHRKQ